jgi:putative DNA primase/helicase
MAAVRERLEEIDTARPAIAKLRASKPFALSDVGNAEFFAARFGDVVRFDHRRGGWLVWVGHRWAVDRTGEVRRLAKKAIRVRLREAASIVDDGKRAAAVRWAATSESRGRLESMLVLAQSEAPIADAGDAWDKDPWLLGVKNGVVNLKTGECRAGRTDDRITFCCGVDFDAAARCPRWLSFLDEVFGGDRALIALVLRALGYSLTGRTTEQCLFLCHGDGANGKSTFLQALRHVWGDYALNTPFSTFESRQRTGIPNDVAALDGRRFVMASETNDGTQLNEARVKAITGSDPVSARFLHQEFFQFDPVAKVWLAVNHRPIVRDDSHGFWRRVRVVPFGVRFNGGNPRLLEELKGEGPGILALLVRECVEWQRHGLPLSIAVASATGRYEADSDPLSDFLDEACERGDGRTVGAADLFKRYSTWATLAGIGEGERLTGTAFGRRMSARFDSKKLSTGKVYTGLALRRDAAVATNQAEVTGCREEVSRS